MYLSVWLDVLLMALGLLAMSLPLCIALCRRFVCPPAFVRPLRKATALLFYLALGGAMAAGIDVGLLEWEQAHRLGNADDIPENVMAPDFSLPSLDEDRAVQLSDFRGHKPVVLIFGNFY